MYQFYDPSIKPILTTDLDGRFIKVQTYGLFNYGYPDIVLNEYIENYEELFLSIIDRIFRVEFDINATWSHNGELFNLEYVKDNLAALVLAPKNDFVKIITINNPLNEEPAKYITKGLTNIYDHPELEIQASIVFSREILAFSVEEIEKEGAINEDYSIEYENHLYTFHLTSDRYGKRLFQIMHKDCGLTPILNTNNKNRSHLYRIK
ncbi:hypothetical protein M2444_006119 [Paenibacillus sp. PastF-3]|uniref:hypothetical protein n=1 Tax=Paenibacillus sp. PastF-3 TaxID=2940626 RepID=UPI002475EB3D|nr:hypothetical protein [Paenibacillus sp. PastF-3]MDH6374269.1 hypothetical protein [Paenibacillus sp. PastF-3]